MKKSQHLLDPELRAAMAALPDLPLSKEALPLMRKMISERYASVAAPAGLTTQVRSIEVERPNERSTIRVVSYRPQESTGALPAILHMHGGGFVVGVPELNDTQHRQIATELGCAIFSVDYRLAPETIFPGQVEDAYAVLQWLTRNADSLGIDPHRIGVKGESAGGGLAAALTLLARDRGEISLAFQHLTFPALDDRNGGRADPHPFTGEFLWTPSHNVFGWTSLLGWAPGGPDVSSYAAPMRAESLAGLPPAFIAVGALDLYLDEDIAYAQRLTRAGVSVELHVYPGAIHGFGIVPGSHIATVSERDLRASIKRAFQRPTHAG